MELVDSDGDRLQFLIDTEGKLREYVNGRLDVKEITSLTYSAQSGKVLDDTGAFTLRPEERVEKALGLRALASKVGVIWKGDEPAQAESVNVVNLDGSCLEFLFTDDGALQETNDGKVALASVQTLHFHLESGTLTDDSSGVFTLPASECVQKAAVLRSMALRAGVRWTGDEPGQPLAARALDIEDCESQWELQCPKRWEQLRPTAASTPKERFCETCKETVYFCSTELELREHVGQRRCVAFDLKEEGAQLSAGSTWPATAATTAPPLQEVIQVRLALLSGQELPRVPLTAQSKVKDLKMALAEIVGTPAECQRLVIENRILEEEETIAEAGVTEQSTVMLLKLPPVQAPEPPRIKKMGKRRRIP